MSVVSCPLWMRCVDRAMDKCLSVDVITCLVPTLFSNATSFGSATIQPYHCCPLPGLPKMDNFLKPSRPFTSDKRVPLRRDGSTETTRSSYASTPPASGTSEWEEEEGVYRPIEQTKTKNEPMSPIVVVCRCKMPTGSHQTPLTQSFLQYMLWRSIWCIRS